MFFNLILENANGDRVDMTATANQYMTSRVKGLNPSTGTISTSSYADVNGSYLNNAFREAECRHFLRDARRERGSPWHKLYNVVKPSRYIKFTMRPQDLMYLRRAMWRAVRYKTSRC